MPRRIHPATIQKARRAAYLRGLGDLPPASTIIPVLDPVTGAVASGAISAGNALADWWNSLFVSGGGPGGIAYNAITGNVSPAQKQNLIAQQTASMIAAGADPAVAAAQANADVTTVLTTYSGPGAFGVTTTGADPSQSWTNWLQAPDANFGVPMWLWLAGGGLAIWFFVKR